MGSDWYSLLEILNYISANELSDGDRIINSKGQQAVYKDGGLYWLTDSRYISNPVSITAEAFGIGWQRVGTGLRIDFPEAMAYLYEGVEVTFTLNHSIYKVDSIEAFEKKVMPKEYLTDVYNASIRVAVEEQEQTSVEEEEPFNNLKAIYNKFVANTVALEDKEPEVAEYSTQGKKITGGEVIAIHKQYHEQSESVANIAKSFDISERMVYYILEGIHWKDAYKMYWAGYAGRGRA